jgi:hypothetical protein
MTVLIAGWALWRGRSLKRELLKLGKRIDELEAERHSKVHRAA